MKTAKKSPPPDTSAADPLASLALDDFSLDGLSPEASGFAVSAALGRKLSDRYVALFEKLGGRVVRDEATGTVYAAVVDEGRKVVILDGELEGYLIREGDKAGISYSQSPCSEAIKRIMAQHPQEAEIAVRVAASSDRRTLYVDLGEPDTDAVVEINADGWQVVEGAPVLFHRDPGSMRPLPRPVRGGDLAELGPLLGLEGENAILATACALGALLPKGPFPILALLGPQGSGKSTAANYLKGLIDPQKVTRPGPPKDGHDLAIRSARSHLLIFDNVSTLSHDLSDAMCRLSDDSGFITRALYTNAGLVSFKGARPVVLTSIGAAALARADLADRAVVVEFPKREQNLPTDLLDARWAEALPRILGALYGAASGALRHLDATPADNLPRLATFARWILAAERAGAMPWQPGEFLEVYGRNRRDVAIAGAEGDPVGAAILEMLPEGAEAIDATAAGLLKMLGQPALLAKADFPRNPRELSDSIRRVAPQLERLGVQVQFRRVHGARKWRLSRMEDSQ